MTIEVMAEIGIDISRQESKALASFVGGRFDYVITLCDRAKELCPAWPDAAQQTHWPFEDPLQATGTEAERRAVFRRVRDDIKRRVQLALLANKVGPKAILATGSDASGGRS